MKVNVQKKVKRKTKTLYYAIVEKMEVPIDATNDLIDDILMRKVTNNGTLDEGKDYIWSYKDDLLYNLNKCIK